MSRYTILMFTEALPIYRRLSLVLENHGCRVLRAGAAGTLAEAIHTREFDLILAQVKREDGENLALLQQAKRLHPRTKVILCSGSQETAFPLGAYELEVDDYIFMPCTFEELCRRVVGCLERLPEKNQGLAPASQFAAKNRGALEKTRRVFEYFRHNLGSSASALKIISNTPGAGRDEKLMAKIHGVSARLEVCQEMTEALLRGLARGNWFTALFRMT